MINRFNVVTASVSMRSSLISNCDLRIALLERNHEQAEHVRSWIEEASCECIVYRTVVEFKRAFYRQKHDLVILDWIDQKSVSGQDVLYWIRTVLSSKVPVVAYSLCDAELDVVQALYAGADDFLVKPIRRNEFLARLHALARRTHRGPATLSCPPYVLDSSNHQLRRGSEVVRLTRIEYELTVYLYRNRGHVVSREQLITSVWGESAALSLRTVDTYISRLRVKLPPLATGCWNLVSIYRHGYRLEELEGTVTSGRNCNSTQYCHYAQRP